MRFSFEGLGNVDRGAVTLGDLTIICGPNNVGKTYVSYAIYGMIRHFQQLIDFSISSEELAELRSQGTLSIDLNSYQPKLSSFLEKASEAFSKRLDSYFNVAEEFFVGAKTEFSCEGLRFDLGGEFRRVMHFGKGESLIFDKAPEDEVLSISLQTENKSKLPARVLESLIGSEIARFLFSGVLPEPFVVTSERTGIALFYKELDLSKNAILEHITGTDKVDPIDLINSMRSRYAQPIHDNINVVRDYENICKKKSFIREDKVAYKNVMDALQDLMGGSYKSINKQVVYVPKKQRGREKIAMPVYVASSSIKSLFLIDLYVNYLAEKKGMLIIDEPELNLHPDNQRKMAGLLARLVNAGIKVLVTTHSDYLIREINNRVMLNLDVEGKASIMKAARMDTKDLLRPDQIRAYSLRDDHEIHEVAVDRFGVNMEIFDNLIAEANELADKIYYGIRD